MQTVLFSQFPIMFGSAEAAAIVKTAATATTRALENEAAPYKDGSHLLVLSMRLTAGKVS